MCTLKACVDTVICFIHCILGIKKEKLHYNWLKNEKVKILEFNYCWLLSVELIFDTVRNGRNLSTYCQRLSAK
jgi:hypothetical protein